MPTAKRNSAAALARACAMRTVRSRNVRARQWPSEEVDAGSPRMASTWRGTACLRDGLLKLRRGFYTYGLEVCLSFLKDPHSVPAKSGFCAENCRTLQLCLCIALKLVLGKAQAAAASLGEDRF